MQGKTLARIGAVVFVAVAITATAIEMTRKEEAPAAWTTRGSAGTPVDPLREKLIQCSEMGEAGTRDASCLRAWAENRARFLAPGARPMERLPAPVPQAEPFPEPPIADDPIRKETAPVPAPQADEDR